MNLDVLGSSSKGNAYLLKTSDEILLIECGVHIKQIKKALNFDLRKVVGCVLTHEHSDHTKAVDEIISAGIEVFASEGTLDALNIKSHRSNSMKKLEQIQIGNFIVLPFDVQHDTAEPFGFLIFHPEFGKLIFATDTYYIKYKFAGLNYIAVECNYSKEILDKNVSAGKLHPSLKRRLLKSHFSLENVKEFLSTNDLSKVEQIMLLHLSDGNSHAANFKNEIERLTGIPVRIC